MDYLLLVIVLLIAADRYYPAAMSMLGMGAEKPCGRNAEGGEGQSNKLRRVSALARRSRFCYNTAILRAVNNAIVDWTLPVF